MRGKVTTGVGLPAMTVTLANMPGRRACILVVEDRPHQDVAGVLIDARIDRLHLAAEDAAGKCIDGHVDGLAGLQIGERLFGDREIDEDRIELLQSDEARARRATYWPRSTLRMPSLPAKGATIFFCAMSARTRSTPAAAVSRDACAASTLALVVLPLRVS